MYRLRLKYYRSDRLKYLSHLDLMRLWERALRRAGLTPLYSEGFSPHPRISVAAPMAIGITSRAELMDVFMADQINPDDFILKLNSQLPAGIGILDAFPVKEDAASLQSSLRYAEYEVSMVKDGSEVTVEDSMLTLMSMESLPWHHSRDTGERYYDLRALIDRVWLIDVQTDKYRIGMRLRSDSKGTGRPEQVIKALGLDSFPLTIERMQLVFS